MSLCRNSVRRSLTATVELGDGPRPNRGSVAQKRCAFTAQNAETNAELKGFDVDSLGPEHIRVNKACRTWHLTACGQIQPDLSSPCHVQMILMGNDQSPPTPEEWVAQETKSQKKPKKTYGLRVNSA